MAGLTASTVDYIRAIQVGDHQYINVYDLLDPVPNMPGAGALIDGQTWLTGLCGEDAVLIGEGVSFDEGESFGTLTPALYGDDASDADATYACGGHNDRVYRVDLFGGSQPELLLTGWTCAVDVERMVTSYQDDEVHELWRVPNFPDLSGAVRLAEGILEEAGFDATHNYYVDRAQALHAVDIRSGDDAVLQTGVEWADGGATGSASRLAQTGSTRLLTLAQPAGETRGVFLYRGETGEFVRLADVAADADPCERGWNFNSYRTSLVQRVDDEDGSSLRVYDLDGAPLAIPANVRVRHVGAEGVLGNVEGPQGARWAYARVGDVEATVLDMPVDAEIHITAHGTDDVWWFRDDQLHRTPLDGGPTLKVDEFGFQYSPDDGLMQRGNQLLHVDWHTNEAEVLVDRIGAYSAVGDLADGEFVTRGVLYTDPPEAKEPGLWFVPVSALPGAE